MALGAEANWTLSDLCSNIIKHDVETKIAGTPVSITCEGCGWTTGWYISDIIIVVVVLVITYSLARENLIQELCDVPSYDLHKKLEDLYKEVAFRKSGVDKLQSLRRYTHVSYQDDRDTMRRTITIVEDLSRDVMPAVNLSIEERAIAPVNDQSSGIVTSGNENNFLHPINPPASIPQAAALASSNSSSSGQADDLPSTEMRTVSETRRDEAARLSPRTPIQRSNYTPVTDSTDSDPGHVQVSELPPPYSAIDDSNDDSDETTS